MNIPLKEAIAALPPLKESLRRHGIITKKSLGQHFLFDLNLTDKIARSAGNVSHATVLEIGPGPGGLTRSLLSCGAARVVAVERDAACMPILHELEAVAGERLRIVETDALALDERAMFRELGITPGDLRIIANLPYNIGTELLFKWLEQPELFSTMILMFQKEVADRIVAVPGCKDYGRLAVMTQWHYAAEKLFDIPPEAFFPPPKVHSSVVMLTRRPAPLAEANREVLSRVVKAAFGQRRKMLRASLRQISDHPIALLEQAGIDPTLRPEDIDIQAFCSLARVVATLSS